MPRSKRQQKALAALNYDLFTTENMAPPAPVTLYTRIEEHASRVASEQQPAVGEQAGDLPTVSQLRRMYQRFNWLYFAGELPSVAIEYSNRMRSAGSWTPERRLIRIGRKYHEIFPDDLADTLKHEMIHIRHFRHDALFKAEAKRIGASLRARSHPSLRRQPRYTYVCPNCGRRYPRQKRLRMASCGVCTPGSAFDPAFKLRLAKS